MTLGARPRFDVSIDVKKGGGATDKISITSNVAIPYCHLVKTNPFK